jgi:hypothetical protein
MRLVAAPTRADAVDAKSFGFAIAFVISVVYRQLFESIYDDIRIRISLVVLHVGNTDFRHFLATRRRSMEPDVLFFETESLLALFSDICLLLRIVDFL